MIWPTQWRTKARDARPAIGWGGMFCRGIPTIPPKFLIVFRPLTIDEVKEKYSDYRDMRGPSPSQVWHDEIQQFYQEGGDGD